MKNETFQNFLGLVKEEFRERISQNSSYSLRSYAKDLGVSPSTLSGLMNGKRTLTAEMVGKIGDSLRWPKARTWKLQKDLLGYNTSEEFNKFKMLSEDIFEVVSEWYYLAILEVMKLPDFKASSHWIAEKLDLEENCISDAINRLQRVGILEVSLDGTWTDKMSGFTTHYDLTKSSSAKRNYQMQLLDQSMKSLERDDFKKRDHSSITMAINTEDIQLAKKDITSFRKSLSSTLESNKAPNAVYQLQVSFFPIT